MADFVTREKEFRKLNERLDDDFKRSTTLNKIEKFKEPRQNPLSNICYDTYRVNNNQNNKVKMGGGNGMGDRFATYTKEKCPILNSLRKAGGGGDCVGVGVVPTKPKSPTMTSPKKTTTTTTKANYGNTFSFRAKTLPKSNGGGGGGGVGCGYGLYAKDNLERRQRFGGGGGGVGVDAQNTARTSSTARKLAPPKDALVVYKNDKFTCSSSMDDIFKRNLVEPTEQEQKDESKAITMTRAETITQPVESLATCGTKSSQKIVNTSSLIRFLKSKVALLEENQARNLEEMNQQKEVYDATIERHKSATQQLDKALTRNAALTEQLEKTNSQLNESNRRCREQSQECLELKKELDSVKRELKHLNLNYRNLEKRYARTKDETENVQNSCTSLRQVERDLKENFRRETEARIAEIKYLKKQRSDLFNAYKKQLFLIDNLRQQNVCMEQAKMIDFCEKEFSKILEWNLKA